MIPERANRFISVLYRYSQRFYARRIQEMGLEIEVGHIAFLIQAYCYPGISQDAVSANISVDKGTTARYMKQLETMGYVRREPDKCDRRVNHIYPTEKAAAIHDRISQLLDELYQVLYAGLTETEIDRTVALLRRMTENMESYFK